MIVIMNDLNRIITYYNWNYIIFYILQVLNRNSWNYITGQTNDYCHQMKVVTWNHISKLADHSQGQPKGFLLNSY